MACFAHSSKSRANAFASGEPVRPLGFVSGTGQSVRWRTAPARRHSTTWSPGSACYRRRVEPETVQDQPFDRALRRLRRDRAAALGAGADYLLRRAADELIERLAPVRRRFADALDLGCGAGQLAASLRARGLAVAAADPGALFAARAGGVQCDEDRLPFADASFDLVVSAGALDSVNDLPGALVLIRRALRPDGLFLAAFAGAGSLPRLRGAMRAAEEAEGGAASPHIHPQIDVRAAGDLLGRAGFALPVADARA